MLKSYFLKQKSMPKESRKSEYTLVVVEKFIGKNQWRFNYVVDEYCC